MGASPIDRRSSFAREQSLRKSFSAIHHVRHGSQNSFADSGRLSPSQHQSSDHHQHQHQTPPSQAAVRYGDSLLKRDRCGKALRRQQLQQQQHLATPSGSNNKGSILRRPLNRRGSSPAAVTPIMKELLVTEGLPALPFNNNATKTEHEARQEPQEPTTTTMAQLAKLKRRHSVVTFATTKEAAAPMDNNIAKSKKSLTPPLPPLPFSGSVEQHHQPQQNNHNHKGFRSDYALGQSIRSPTHMIIEPTPSATIAAVNSLNKHDFAFVKRSNGSYSYAILAYRSMEPIKTNSATTTTSSKKTTEETMEECMVFVISDVGSTKMIRKRHWSEGFVRLPSSNENNGVVGPISNPFASSSKSRSRSVTPTTPPTTSVDQQQQKKVLLCQEIPPVEDMVVKLLDALPSRSSSRNNSPKNNNGKRRSTTTPSNNYSSLEEEFSKMVIVVHADDNKDEECSLISSVSDRARMMGRKNRGLAAPPCF